MFSKIRSLIFKLDPEKAHDLAIKALKTKVVPVKAKNYDCLKVKFLEKDHPIFDKLIEYAIKYFNDVIKKNKKYKKPNSEEKKALESLVRVLEKCSDEMQPEEIQTEIYTVGKENGYKDNLRDWFRLIYEVVFGDENGPRMGFFISFFGVKETQQLIKDKIN